MKTYQDLLNVGQNERERINFIKECISKFEQSAEYRFVKDAELYYRGENPTIARAQKIVYDMLGQAHADTVSPSHKIYSRFFFSAVTELTQYLLGNGVSFDNNSVKEKLGKDFDTKMQDLADDAQIAGVAWGFWNLDHLETIPFLQFIPLPDENDSTIKAGVRFWRVDSDKPLHVILFELDGITEYIQPKDGEMVILNPKRQYKLNVEKFDEGTMEVMSGENYPSFPVIPLYFINHDSMLYGNRQAIDAYDLMLSKMVNSVDEGNLVYWVLTNCNGMDEVDDANFLANLLKAHVAHANGDAGAGAEPHTIEAPIDGTEKGIERIKRLLNENFMTADTETLRAGTVTATQIKAAYSRLDAKTAKFEYCVIDFIQRLLVVAGINPEEKFSFKYDRAFNSAEQVTTILQAAQYLDEETVRSMLLEAMGKIDLVEEVQKRVEEEAMTRYGLKDNQPPEIVPDAQNAPQSAV